MKKNVKILLYVFSLLMFPAFSNAGNKVKCMIPVKAVTVKCALSGYAPLPPQQGDGPHTYRCEPCTGRCCYYTNSNCVCTYVSLVGDGTYEFTWTSPNEDESEVDIVITSATLSLNPDDYNK